jgi:NhaP-type Na+/H+ or K+/H+ antiporter
MGAGPFLNKEFHKRMKNTLLVAIASIPVVGVMAQWVSWMFGIPAIVLYLICGFLLGPILGIIQPDVIFGATLYPFVSMFVAIILFEGGLSLKFSDLRKSSRVFTNLVTIGAVLTWLMTGTLAYWCFGFTIAESFLLGAILVVTGPTVIIPLLKQIKIKRSVTSILRWEGIVIDPIGASISVLMFDIVIAQNASSVFKVAVTVILSTIGLGVVLGGLGAVVLIGVIKHKWIPSTLNEGFTLIIVLLTYVLSNTLQAESGLLVVTIMGIIMANQKVVVIRDIITFKEQLVTLLLSSLFIILAATTKIDQLMAIISWKMIIFVSLLIVVIRPVMVFVAAIGSDLTRNDKLFMSFMAPRGIVAAAVAALFSMELQQKGVAIGGELLSIVFVVIIVTVVVYGLLGRPLAYILNMKPSRQGVLIIGANDWAREMAQALLKAGISIMMVDTNRENIVQARCDGLHAIHANGLSNRVIDEVEGGAVDTLLAVTPNDELNVLATLEYCDQLGEDKVFRLSATETLSDFSSAHSGRQLFARRVTHTFLDIKKTTGYNIKLVTISNDYPLSQFLTENRKAIPMFLVDHKNDLTIISVQSPLPQNRVGQLIAMV